MLRAGCTERKAINRIPENRCTKGLSGTVWCHVRFSSKACIHTTMRLVVLILGACCWSSLAIPLESRSKGVVSKPGNHNVVSISARGELLSPFFCILGGAHVGTSMCILSRVLSRAPLLQHLISASSIRGQQHRNPRLHSAWHDDIPKAQFSSQDSPMASSSYKFPAVLTPRCRWDSSHTRRHPRTRSEVYRG